MNSLYLKGIRTKKCLDFCSCRLMGVLAFIPRTVVSGTCKLTKAGSCERTKQATNVRGVKFVTKGTVVWHVCIHSH